MAVDFQPFREVLLRLEPSIAHKALDRPEVIYPAPDHADALDPSRVLVVGGRGVGKSFWTSVLADEESRRLVSMEYPNLGLDQVDVELGYHEGALGSRSVAPTWQKLRRALDISFDSETIWQSVLLRAIAPEEGPKSFIDRVEWVQQYPEIYEDLVINADLALQRDNRVKLLVFDALDLLGQDWGTIRTLTKGLLILAREMSARRSIRLKVFMRRDQFEDLRRNPFPDFSKLATAAVHLRWKTIDLYGALYTYLWKDDRSRRTFQALCKTVGIDADDDSFPRILKRDEHKQHMLFSSIAGEFMGTNAKRGKVYTWIPKHLADAFGDTSLRSFLLALREAAREGTQQQHLAIDYKGINTGVLKASETRLDELKEDHPWVEIALTALEGLAVPCPREDFLARWKERSTIDTIRSASSESRPTAPIELDLSADNDQEESLLKAMIDIGIAEERGSQRINVPDIFRVAAKMKRKGGVPPRKR